MPSLSDEHPEADALVPYRLGELVEWLDAHALNGLADLRGVGVEGGRDRKVLPPEATVAQERLAEIARADHRHAP